MNKKVLNDTGSAVAEELVNQLNAQAVPYDGIISITMPATEDDFTLCSMHDTFGGIWIKDITVALDYAAGNVISSALTSFRLLGMPHGDWATHYGVADFVTYFERTNFALNNIAGDQVLSLNGVNSVVEVGTFPMWIPAPNQLRFHVISGEGGVWNLTPVQVSIWCKPVVDTLTIPPSYLNKLRNFQVT